MRQPALLGPEVVSRRRRSPRPRNHASIFAFWGNRLSAVSCMFAVVGLSFTLDYLEDITTQMSGWARAPCAPLLHVHSAFEEPRRPAYPCAAAWPVGAPPCACMCRLGTRGAGWLVRSSQAAARRLPSRGRLELARQQACSLQPGARTSGPWLLRAFRTGTLQAAWRYSSGTCHDAKRRGQAVMQSVQALHLDEEPGLLGQVAALFVAVEG